MKRCEPRRRSNLLFLLVCTVLVSLVSASVNARNMRVSIEGDSYIAEITHGPQEFRAWTDTGGAPSEADGISDPVILAKLYSATRAFLFIEHLLERESASSLLTSNQVYAEATLAELNRISNVEELANWSANISGQALGVIFASQFVLAPAHPAISPIHPTALVDLSGLAITHFMTLGDILFPELVDILLASEVEIAAGMIDEAVQLASGLPMSAPDSRAVDIDEYTKVANNIVNGVDYFTDISLRVAQDDRLNGDWEDDARNYSVNVAKGFLSIFVPDVGGATSVVTAGWTRELLDMHSHISTAIDASNAIESFLNWKFTVHNKGYFGTSPQKFLEYLNFFSDKESSAGQADPSLLIDTSEPDLIEVVTGVSANDTSDARIYMADSILLEGYSGVQGVLIMLSEPLAIDVSFEYSVYSINTSDPTEASTPSDFKEELNLPFRIPAGSDFGVIPVTVYDDITTEALSEKFRVAIYNVSGASLPYGRYNDVFTGVILDDDYIIENTLINLDGSNGGEPGGDPQLPPTTSGCNLTALSVGSGAPGGVGGGLVDISYTVANAGDSDCRGGRIQLFIANGTTDSDSTYYGPDIFDLPPLEPGERYSRNRDDVRLPNIGPGDRYLGLEVSSLLGDEDVASDNRVYLPFTIGAGIAGLPELRVTVGSAHLGDVEHPVALWNQAVRLDYRIRAYSEGAPPYQYRILLSKDEYISPEDIVIDTLSDRGLGYHGVHYYDHDVVIPPNVATGSWYLIVQADPSNEISEDDESNNADSTPVIIHGATSDESGGLPNLYAGHLRIENPVLSYLDYLKFKITAVPTSPSVPLFDSENASYYKHEICLYMSRDTVLDDTDIVFFRQHDYLYQPIGGLGGMSVNFPGPDRWLSDPDFGSGTYYIFAKADCGGSLTEYDEADNTDGPVQISYLAAPSKSVAAVDDIVNVRPGEIAVFDILANDTSTPSQSLTVEFFGGDKPASEEPVSFLDDDTGAIFNVEQEGTIAVDTSSVPNDLSGLPLKRFLFPYIVKGGADYDRSVGYVEIVLRSTNLDQDGDGVPDLDDNCMVVPNPVQLNTDGADDGGDACDLDDDNDGLTDQQEAIIGTDPIVSDTDVDGVSDGLDAFPLNIAASLDDDEDGLPDAWSVSCDLTCQSESGLRLDDDPISAACPEYICVPFNHGWRSAIMQANP